MCVLSCSVMFTLGDPMDCSLPGSSVHGISQQRMLEWVAMPSYGIFPTQGLKLHLPHLLHWQTDSLPAKPWGKPQILVIFSLIKRKMVRLFKEEPRRKNSSLISQGNGPRDEAEVTNMGKPIFCFLSFLIWNLGSWLNHSLAFHYRTVPLLIQHGHWAHWPLGNCLFSFGPF